MTDDELDAALDAALAKLSYPDPAPDFADRVMAQVAVPEAPRRPSRLPLAVAASLAAMLFGSLAASAIWTLGHQAMLPAAGRWLAATAGEWTLQGLGSAISFLVASPATAFLHKLEVHPSQLAAVSAVGSLLYGAGVLALRHLLNSATPRIAHVQG